MVERPTSAQLQSLACGVKSVIIPLDKGDVLLLTGINRLNRAIVPILAPAMLEFVMGMIIGKGPDARRMKLALKPFTLIGTVQKQTDCTAEVLRAFEATVQLQRYTRESLAQLTLRLAELAKIEIEPEAAALVANLADGNPGRVESILRKLRLVEQRPVSVHDAQEMLALLGYSVPRSEFLGHYGNVALNLLSGIEFERLDDYLDVPLPWGTKPRLILAHLNAEARRQGSPIVAVEDSLTQFVKRLRGFKSGRELRMFKDQLTRLSTAEIRLTMISEGRQVQINTHVVTRVPGRFVEFYTLRRAECCGLLPRKRSDSAVFFDDFQRIG